MAYIRKDGFDFLEDLKGNPEAFVLKGDSLKEELNYIKENNITSIYLNHFDSKSIDNLEFLKEINFIVKVNLNDVDVDYSGLYYLDNLKSAIIGVKNKKQYLDYSRFKNLEYLSIDWYSQFPDLSNNTNLKELVIWKFKPKSKSFSELKLPKELDNFEITESNILNFEGLKLPRIKKLELNYCNAIESFESLNKFNSSLEVLVLDSCKKLVKYDNLGGFENLSKIILSNCGDISNLKWLSKLKKVNHFSFWNTKLIDGDTSPCFNIDFVSFKNAKHYNHKEEEFTKKITNKGV